MSDPAAEAADQVAAEAAVNLLARARAAVEEDGSEQEIADEVAAEVEEMEQDAAANVSRGCPAAAEYAFVEAVKAHLKAWGYWPPRRKAER